MSVADKEQLSQRYADLLGPESEPEPGLLEITARLDEAAAPYRRLEPPRGVDQAIEQLAARRRPVTASGRLPETVPAALLPHDARRPAGDPPNRSHHNWLRQGLGMAAAVLALALLTALLIAVLGGQRDRSSLGHGGAETTRSAPSIAATPGTSGTGQRLTFEQAQALADFHLIKPGWVPPSLEDHGLIAPDINSTPAGEAARPGVVHGIIWTFAPRDSPRDPSQRYSMQIQEHASNANDQPAGIGLGTPAPVTIVNQDVMRTGLPSRDVKTVLYQWTEQGTYVQIIAQIAGPLTEPDVMQMIASMIQQGASGPSSDADGRYLGITFAQAEQLAPYHLAQPSWVPSYLADRGLAASAVPHFDQSTGQLAGYGVVNDVAFSYSAPDSTQRFFVQFDERPGSVHQSFPPSSTTTTLTITGHSVTRTVFTTAGNTVTNFYWQDQGTAFIATAQLSGPLTEQDVEHMIASMLP